MEKLKNEYDVIIIGGGITGAGILRDCAMRGLKTLLLEKGEFGGATTLASSCLIHGGGKYLKDDFDEAKTCSIETGYIYRIAKDFLKKIVFLMPFFKGEKKKMEIMEIGCTAYDILGKYNFTNPHARLTGKEALKLVPELNPEIIGALTFEEWQVDPQKFVKAHIESAMLFGAEAQCHMEVVDFMVNRGAINGVTVLDKVTKKTAQVMAKIVVNAAGPWAGKVAGRALIDFKLRPTKGIHLVLDAPLKYGLAFDAIDKRGLIAQPRDGKIFLGTTDDDYYGDLDNLKTTADEEKYLLEALERILPGKSKAPILKRIAGVRPTIWQWGMPEDKVSRKFVVIDHQITDGLDGLITVCGGKMTIYRVMAEMTCDMICQKLNIQKSCQTHLQKLLPPSKFFKEEKSDRKIRKYYQSSFVLNKKTLPAHEPLQKIRTYGFLAAAAFVCLIRKMPGKSKKDLKYLE